MRRHGFLGFSKFVEGVRSSGVSGGGCEGASWADAFRLRGMSVGSFWDRSGTVVFAGTVMVC